MRAWIARTIGVKSTVRRRIALVVDDVEARRLGVLARPLARVLPELGVGIGERDGLRLRVLRLRHLEEAAGERRLRRRAVRDHREIFVVDEVVVDASAEQADEQLLALDRDRHRRGDLGRGIARDDQVDLVDVEELGVDRRDFGRLALVVIVDELDGPAEQAALGIDVGLPTPASPPATFCRWPRADR